MLQELTRQLMDGQDLSESESEQALDSILSEEPPDSAVGSFLTALSIKGETPEEITGFVRVMRQHARPVKSSHETIVDTAGTGGGRSTFNISTTAVFVIAGAGVAVAKHGNRAITSRCGSADLLSSLGVSVAAGPETGLKSLDSIGVAFLFAPAFHPAMKRVAQVRRDLGHRTIFNLLGPLTNPAGAPYQIIGVYGAELTEKLGGALARLGCGQAWVVHGQDGMDELSTSAPSHVCEVAGTQLRSFRFDPADWGLESAPDEDIPQGGTPEENAQISLGILEGRIGGPARRVVVLNAAAALHVAGVSDFAEAVSKAEESLDSGAARSKLDQLIQVYSGT